MKILKLLFGKIAGCTVLSFMLIAAVSAQDSPITINLVSSKAEYQPGEPVKMQVNVVNNSGHDLIVPQGFMQQEFYLLIKYTAPDGTIIRNSFIGGDAEPGPPRWFQGRECAPVEIIPQGWGSYKVIDDARIFYDLTKCGFCKAEIEVPLVTYFKLEIDQDGNTLGCMDDPGIRVFNPLTSIKVAFEILPEKPAPASLITVKVRGIDGALDNLPVRLYRLSDISVAINEETYTEICDKGELYSLIWNNLVPVASGFTDTTGTALFTNFVKDNYLIMAFVNYSEEYRYLGGFIKASDKNWKKQKPITVTLEPKDEKYWKARSPKNWKKQQKAWEDKWKKQCKKKEKDRDKWEEEQKKWKKLKKEKEYISGRDDEDSDMRNKER
ncbi:MAG: hypothetical protein C4538_10335 [Nitrospiraceae bacterium]|nr:MAG: hypothetical protein C4538_10335 [Nitrospiraceae bacterium]